MGVSKIPKKPIAVRVNEDIDEKLEAEAKEKKTKKSKVVNRILNDHYFNVKQTELSVWVIQPKKLYCPQYGWLQFDRIMSDCQKCLYRTGQGRTRCPMWYSSTAYASGHRDPPEVIKHKK
jgi:hypothetical protein